MRILNCGQVTIEPYYVSLSSTNNKIKIDTTNYVSIVEISGDAEDISIASQIEIDSTSQVDIQFLNERRGQGEVLFAKPNIRVRNYIGRTGSIIPAHKLSINPLCFGSNMLINGSFNAGLYGWIESSGGFGVYTIVASSISNGLMLNAAVAVTRSINIYQNITITADMVEKPFTLSGMVNCSVGAWVSLYTVGCGCDSGSGIERAYAGTGWQMISRTIIPQSAGTLSLGIVGVNIQSIQIEDLSFRYGMSSVPATDSFGSVDISGKSVVFATAIPATGTWVRGSIVKNSSPSVGSPKGWVCTVAGSPGTWVSEGNL